jgi:hypothetical protein
MSPDCQCLTLRELRRTHSIIDSHGFVDSSVHFSAPLIPSRVTVTVSSSPSRSDAAALGEMIADVSLLVAHATLNRGVDTSTSRTALRSALTL